MTTRTVNITVAIATLDRPEGLMRCLEAVLNGQMLPYEVIIVDQSHTTATVQAMQRWVESQTPPAWQVPVECIRQNRRGLSASRNAAIARARTPVIAFTDDDCVPEHSWVLTLDQAFARAPIPDTVSGRVLPLGPEQPGQHAVSTRVSTKATDYQDGALPWLVGTGGNLAIKRDWFERVGPFDERLGSGAPGKGGEDVDVLYRLLRAGARCRYDPDVVLYHERQDSRLRSAKSWAYSFGIGACCGLWVRRGQVQGGYLFAVRLYHMLRDSAQAFTQHDRLQAAQRWIAVRGVCAGLVWGLRQPGATRAG